MQNSSKHYSCETCRNLANTYERDADKLLDASNQNSAIKKAEEYFHDHCFYTAEGGYFVYRHGVLEQFKETEFENTFGLKGFPKKLKDRIKNNMPEYTMTLTPEHFEINKEKRLINMFKPIYASTLKPVKEENIKEANEYVEFVKVYLREIVASSVDITYTYLLKHIALILKGSKVPISINLFTSTEGSGKTTLALLLKALVGAYNTCFISPENIVLYNWECYGKPLVVIQETESVKCSNTAFNDKMKNMIDAEYFEYRKMYQQPMNLKNINNIITTTNFPMSGQAGRRIINLSISTKWLGDYDKWNKLNKFTDDNIKALYDFFMTIDTNGFNAELEAKKVEVEVNGNRKNIDKMNDTFKFMKEKYALPKKDATLKNKAFYDDFCSYCDAKGVKAYTRDTFIKQIGELNIAKRKLNGYEMFCVKGVELYNEFKKRNLLSEEEELEYHEKVQQDGEISKSMKAIDTFVNEREIELEEENKSLKQEIEALKKQIEEMRHLKTDENKDENKVVKQKRAKAIHSHELNPCDFK